ncbi:ABC transporter substrate-binding protein [Mesorhizobium mediterraneum]|uniref:ABC transporter substrate-binding protein n=3 Tax=Mesorhizobium TaxID=68287 RepID=A0AB36RGR3_9HYPH|nr:ABC transporter substrate-binding protein [Mesorhizobium mediterraneum]PAQ04048.1 ABC transporter substrate-binding protein [Mesorhizobium mediterraneum]RWN31607.1 MAG: ABC transporter substrate-binding protein [Mesorhizobium sp.]RWO94915.1 MAG: ABC transporter substrate-binding protein [Mesorhizobium sp.]WIW50696.1 ABC transporter substrate-binding protein [Mesorhizobium mediterraneum]
MVGSDSGCGQMRWFRPGSMAVLLLAFSVLAPSCGFKALAAETVVDASGRTVATGPATRILTLGSDVTEIVDALGAGERIIAVDRGSKYPASVAQKPNVGYRRQLSVEGLVGLRPDLILAAEDSGPPEAVEVLKSLAIPVVFVPEDNSPQGIERKITLIAAALRLEDKGREVSRRVLHALRAAADLTAKIPAERRKKVVFFHGLVRLSAAGAGTAADAIIRYAGGINPMAVVKGYKPASEEKLVEMAPDVILMMSDGKGGPTAEQVFGTRALSATPAAKTKTLIVLDGAYMIGFGPRTADAIRDLAQALYPEVADAD